MKRALAISALLLLPLSAASGRMVTERVEAPFTAIPQSRMHIYENGNKLQAFVQLIPSDGGKLLIYGVSESALSRAGSRLKYLPGWGQRVIAEKAAADSGFSYSAVSVVEMSETEQRLGYEIKVSERALSRQLQDGFGFATAKRFSSDLFLQIQTECMGYSKEDCLSLHLEFLSDVKVVD